MGKPRKNSGQHCERCETPLDRKGRLCPSCTEEVRSIKKDRGKKQENIFKTHSWGVDGEGDHDETPVRTLAHVENSRQKR